MKRVSLIMMASLIGWFIPSAARLADVDNDGMLDSWEALHPCLQVGVNDALADPDHDGLENIHEYYKGSDPCVAEPHGRPGIGYFGDADGSLSIGTPDIDQISAIFSGFDPDYSAVYPANPMVQDLDGSGSLGTPDLDYISAILSGFQVTPAGWPTLLAQELPVGTVSVIVGRTVAIKVKLTTAGDLARPGFGVVFKVASGSATLYGGDGPGASPGSRYALTDVNGEARMVAKATAAGNLQVQVELPAPDPGPSGMQAPRVALPSNVLIQTCVDADRDGYYSQSGCGTAVDCNDNNSSYHPGAMERSCAHLDYNCNGRYDDTWVCTMEYMPVCGWNGCQYGNSCEAWGHCSSVKCYVGDPGCSCFMCF